MNSIITQSEKRALIRGHDVANKRQISSRASTRPMSNCRSRNIVFTDACIQANLQRNGCETKSIAVDSAPFYHDMLKKLQHERDSLLDEITVSKNTFQRTLKQNEAFKNIFSGNTPKEYTFGLFLRQEYFLKKVNPKMFFAPGQK